jgi:hypothetical protein
MANPLALFDFNNPTILAPRPSAGSRVNYISEPGNPGQKPIFDQLYDQLTFFFDQSDATQVGKGIRFDNIANRAVRPENMRLRIDQPFKNYHVQIDNGLNNGGGFTQVDGQTPLRKPVVPVFQIPTNFRNFQAGVDNVTAEIDIIIDKGFMQNAQGMNAGTSWTPQNWYSILAGNTTAQSQRNVKIFVWVGSSLAMTDAVLISKESFYGYSNYTMVEQGSWSMKIIDKTSKLYQNPCYKIELGLEKAPGQAAAVVMGLALQALVTVTTKATNSAM